MFPNFFTRPTNIFVSYASENAELANGLAHALRNEGYDVFIDKSELIAGESFHSEIRERIVGSDMMIVLLSSHAIRPNSFVLTELSIAEDVWPAAQGKVVPVIIEPDLEVEQVPAYVRAVHILSVKGDPVGDIIAELAKLRGRPKIANWLASGLLVAALAILTYFVLSSRPVDVQLVQIDRLHFRPLSEAPKDLFGPDRPQSWSQSVPTITVDPLTLIASHASGKKAHILDADLVLNLSGEKHRFKWLYIVKIKARCTELCRTEVAKPFDLAGGQSWSQQLMFRPKSTQLSWRKLFKKIGSDADVSVNVSITYETTGVTGKKRKTLVSNCLIQKSNLEALTQSRWYKDEGLFPPFWTPTCDAPSVPNN